MNDASDNNDLRSRQRFVRGDVVRVSDKMPPRMSHFDAGFTAVVIGSYHDQYGGNRERDFNEYTIREWPEGSRGGSWYDEDLLSFVEHVGELGIKQMEDRNSVREKRESDVEWIASNWHSFKETGVPGASVSTLCSLLGCNNPCGANGEGFDYVANASAAIAMLEPALETGSAEEVRKLAKKLTKST